MGLFPLLLAISVILAHSTGTMPFVQGLVDGPAAVQCFFMLSGFYMTLVLHEKYDSALPSIGTGLAVFTRGTSLHWPLPSQ
jgi:peptidoglycan/LPS O-acetylase OafA/YrhL